MEQGTIFWCTHCVSPSTRPRIVFNAQGVCNACVHAENKQKKIDWKKRRTFLEKLCDRFRKSDGYFDVLVPGSGGKDSVYVAWKMREMGMNPLTVTLAPHLSTEMGKQNLEAFIKSDFDHLLITPRPSAIRKLAKLGFVEQGRPSLAATVGFQTAVIRIAIRLGIPFIMYGEEGESEYGGVTELADRHCKDRDTMVRIYFSGFDPNRYVGQYGITPSDIMWWELPSQSELDHAELTFAFWSYFEDWDPYDHYLFAKEKSGIEALPSRSIGTYTNYAQLDDAMQDLHVYLMYLKFGFGRATSDACIDIRRGALDRKQGLALVRRYDGEYPESLIGRYLDFFGVTREQFESALDRHANRLIFEKKDGLWKPKFAVN